MAEELTKIALSELALGMYVVSIVNPKKNINVKEQEKISNANDNKIKLMEEEKLLENEKEKLKLEINELNERDGNVTLRVKSKEPATLTDVIKFWDVRARYSEHLQ